MNTHELARILLENDDMTIAAHANNHTSNDQNIRVCLMKIFGGKTVVGIGNFSRKYVNHPNDYVIKELDGLGELPKNWSR